MGSTEDPNHTPDSAYESSASQPFLSKPSYPIEEHDSHDSESNQQYLHISYNHGPRSFKDLPFLILFLLFLLSTFAFGIFSIFHRNTNYSTLSSYTYDSNTTSCVKTQFSTSSPNWVWLDSSSSDPLVKDLIWTLVITFVISVPMCWALLLLLKHYTKQIVYASIPFFIVIPIFLNVYWFVACTVNTSCDEVFPLAYRILVMVFIFLVIGVIVWILVVNWHRVELTVSIIGVASDALSWNLGLFVVLPCLTIGLVVYYVPIVIFMVFAKFNGKIVAKNLNGEEYDCVWKEDSWVPAYFALAILTMLWSAAAMLEAQVYVISGTIARWYFSKENEAPTRSIRTSLRNAFGPSSGTICLSGLLIFVVRVVRSAVDNARQEAPGIVNLVLRCCVNALLTAVDFLNKFTINFAAITGEAYCSSARMTYELLRRNLLSAVFVETISSRLLVGIVFVLSAIYTIVSDASLVRLLGRKEACQFFAGLGYAVYIVCSVYPKTTFQMWIRANAIESGVSPDPRLKRDFGVCVILKAGTNLGSDSYFVAAMAWALLLIVLGFLVHVLDNVIDTIYVCYAIDRDRGEVCKQDVHEVYVHLPISRSLRQSIPTRTLGV